MQCSKINTHIPCQVSRSNATPRRCEIGSSAARLLEDGVDERSRSLRTTIMFQGGDIRPRDDIMSHLDELLHTEIHAPGIHLDKSQESGRPAGDTERDHRVEDQVGRLPRMRRGSQVDPMPEVSQPVGWTRMWYQRTYGNVWYYSLGGGGGGGHALGAGRRGPAYGRRFAVHPGAPSIVGPPTEARRGSRGRGWLVRYWGVTLVHGSEGC
jgi:hypothetical protein